MIQIIYYIFFCLTLFYGLYYSLTGLYGFFKPKKFRILPNEPKNKFAIIIAARNEEAVIGNLVTSLLDCNYPKELYDVYVAVNNTTDNTAKVARNAGGIVIDVKKKVKSKGEVLCYVFDELKSHKDIDAYIIFDADNIVHPDFLSRMNDTLCCGYRVAQGFRDSKNISDNWISGSYSLFYYMQNFFFNKSRMTLNQSCSINGTGFMIKKEIIDKDGFHTYTMTEDIEFTAQCALKDERIAFVENAITYDEQPVEFKASWKQRKRWSAGIIQCMNIYSFKLFKKYLKTKNLACLDMSLVYLGPLMQVISFINLVMLVIFKIVGIQLHDIFSYFFATNIVFFAVVLAMGIAIEIFALLYKKKDLKGMTASIILFSIFVLSWIPINISVFVKKYNKWEAIKHTRSIKIDDIKK